MLLPDSSRKERRRSRQYYRHSHPHHLILTLGILLAFCIRPAYAQSGLLEAHIVEGDGQVNRAASHLSHPLVVEVTDETGTVVEGAKVSFRVPEDGPSGTFKNGLKTEILTTDGDGRVALHTLETGGLAGQFQIRMTVAKGGARAGVISNQFIAPDTRRSTRIRTGILGQHRRVLEVGALILAVAASGYAKQILSRTSGGPSVQQPPTIGVPTITIGKP